MIYTEDEKHIIQGGSKCVVATQRRQCSRGDFISLCCATAVFCERHHNITESAHNINDIVSERSGFGSGGCLDLDNNIFSAPRGSTASRVSAPSRVHLYGDDATRITRSARSLGACVRVGVVLLDGARELGWPQRRDNT